MPCCEAKDPIATHGEPYRDMEGPAPTPETLLWHCNRLQNGFMSRWGFSCRAGVLYVEVGPLVSRRGHLCRFEVARVALGSPVPFRGILESYEGLAQHEGNGGSSKLWMVIPRVMRRR